MYFNDGSDPWTVEENYIKVFDFANLSGSTAAWPGILVLLTTVAAGLWLV